MRGHYLPLLLPQSKEKGCKCKYCNQVAGRLAAQVKEKVKESCCRVSPPEVRLCGWREIGEIADFVAREGG